MATYPNRRAQLVDALRHRLTEVEKRRTPADDAERYPIALYHHVATLAPVAGCEVLEVGR